MSKRSKNIFAARVDDAGNDRLYVRLEAMMQPIIALCDGIPLTFFGKDRKNPYLDIDTAIEWAEKEAGNSSRRNGLHARMVVALNAAKRQFVEGKAVEAAA